MDKPPVDSDRIDDAVLALLWLGVCDEDRVSGALRAWKSFDWAAMDRLHQKGLIGDPVGKAKSVGLTEGGAKRAEALFDQLFRRPTQPPARSSTAAADRSRSADGPGRSA